MSRGFDSLRAHQQSQSAFDWQQEVSYYPNRPAFETPERSLTTPIVPLSRPQSGIRKEESEMTEKYGDVVDWSGPYLATGDDHIQTISAPIMAAFAAAQPLLTWPDDWDGEGSPGYQEATLERARAFVVEQVPALWHIRHRSIPAPRVAPGPDGSIDLHWCIDKRELLANVPVSEEEVISFYGDDPLTKVKGEVGVEADPAWLFEWLVR